LIHIHLCIKEILRIAINANRQQHPDVDIPPDLDFSSPEDKAKILSFIDHSTTAQNSRSVKEIKTFCEFYPRLLNLPQDQ